MTLSSVVSYQVDTSCRRATTLDAGQDFGNVTTKAVPFGAWFPIVMVAGTDELISSRLLMML